MVLRNSKTCRHCGDLFVPGGAHAAHEHSCGSGASPRRRRAVYRELFLMHNGAGPYECFFECEVPVEYVELIVHHIDDDFTNNTISNLSSAHRSCHNGHHLADLWRSRRSDMMGNPATRGHRTPHTQETRTRISENHRREGIQPSESARHKAIDAWTGSSQSDGAKLEMSNYAKNRTPEHTEKLRSAHIGQTRSAEARKRMSDAAKARHLNKRKEGDAI